MANKPPRPITSVADSAVRSSWSFPICNLRLYLPRDPPGERWFRTRASDPASLITHGLSPTSAPLVLCMLGVFEGFTEHDETAISFLSFFVIHHRLDMIIVFLLKKPHLRPFPKSRQSWNYKTSPPTHDRNVRFEVFPNKA